MKSRATFVVVAMLLVSSLWASERRVDGPRTLVSRDEISPGVESEVFRNRQGVIERINGGNTVDEYERNAGGRNVRMTTSFRGLTFTASMTDQEISIPGFPKLQLVYRPDGRLEFILTADGRPLSYVYDDNDDVREIQLGGTHMFALQRTADDKVRHTLRDAAGNILRDTTSPVYAARRASSSSVALDVARNDLGLDINWPSQVRERWNSTGSVMTLVDAAAKPLAYVWRFEGLWVVYDLQGRPLFLQLFMDAYTRTTQTLWGLPSLFTMTPDGGVGIHSDLPLEAGLEGVWVNATEVGILWIDARPSNGPKSELVAYCESTVCVTDTTSSTQTCWNRSYICEDGSYPPPSTGGGGTGGGTGTGGTTTAPPKYNFLSGTLGASVGRAIDAAKTKLANDQCKSIFDSFKTRSGQTLTSVLQAANKTGASYLTDVMRWRPGQTQKDQYNRIPCSETDTVAWTSPGSPTVYVCNAWEKMGSTSARVRTIHEELHSLGVSENPPDPNGPTDTQINDAISQNCS